MVLVVVYNTQWLRIAFSKGPNRVGLSSSHLRTETDAVSETLWFPEYWTMDNVRKLSNSQDSAFHCYAQCAILARKTYSIPLDPPQSAPAFCSWSDVQYSLPYCPIFTAYLFILALCLICVLLSCRLRHYNPRRLLAHMSLLYIYTHTYIQLCEMWNIFVKPWYYRQLSS
jgi:hypothetical protein